MLCKVAIKTGLMHLTGEVNGVKNTLQTLIYVQTKNARHQGCNAESPMQEKPTEPVNEKRKIVMPPELENLPMLTSLDHTPDPIGEVAKIWFEGCMSRPLKDIDAAPKAGFKRYPDGRRDISERAKKIRRIGWVIELLQFSGKGIGSLRDWFHQMRSSKASEVKTLDALSKRIETELKKASLTVGKKSQTALDIFNNKNYECADLFWKGI